MIFLFISRDYLQMLGECEIFVGDGLGFLSFGAVKAQESLHFCLSPFRIDIPLHQKVIFQGT